MTQAEPNIIFIQVPYFTIYTFSYLNARFKTKYVKIQSKPFAPKFKVKCYKDAESKMKKDYPNVKFHLSYMLESFETRTVKIKLTSE